MDIGTLNTTPALFQSAQAQTALAAKNVTGNSKADPENIKAIEQAAKDFEAVFLTEMLKPMFAELKPDPTFGGGKGEEIFRGFMLQEYGKMMAENHSIGIADQVKAEMIRIQEEAQK